MKKITLQLAAFSMALLMIFAFSSCEKEGVYNPKQKIKRVSYDSSIGKTISQEWTWNKNLLEKIDYYWNNKIEYTERYSYEKKRVVKVEGDVYYYKVTYDGSKYKLIEYYYKNTLEESFAFEYSGNKISKVTITAYYDNGWKGGFLASIFSKETMASMDKFANKEKKSKSEASTYTMTFTYDGNNIKEEVLTYLEVGYSYTEKTTYDKYDTKALNPFYKFLEEGMPASPKNLPLEARVTETDIEEGWEPDVYTYKLQYTYSLNKKNYPTEVNIKKIDEDGDVYNYRIYYEYED